MSQIGGILSVHLRTLRGVGLGDDHFLWSYGFRNVNEFNLRQWLKIGG